MNLNIIFLKEMKTIMKIIDESVKKILDEVKQQGDQALIKYTKAFDKIDLRIEELLLSKAIINSYKDKINHQVYN